MVIYLYFVFMWRIFSWQNIFFTVLRHSHPNSSYLLFEAILRTEFHFEIPSHLKILVIRYQKTILPLNLVESWVVVKDNEIREWYSPHLPGMLGHWAEFSAVDRAIYFCFLLLRGVENVYYLVWKNRRPDYSPPRLLLTHILCLLQSFPKVFAHK